MKRGSLEQGRRELAERLRARRGEIEEALLTRTYAIADPSEIADPEYAQGLRAAVSAALEYAFEGIERGEERVPPVPTVLLAQARLAARNGVPLDTVLRRYFAGYSLLSYFIVEEVGDGDLMRGPELQRQLASQAALFDRLLAAISEEHMRESETLHLSSEQRRTERVERLLAGELVETSGLTYEFGGWHLGLVASGAGAERAIRELAAGTDCRLLLLRREEEMLWAWLGARQRIDPAEPSRSASRPDADSVLAIGEPGEGLAGWRLTHRQAAAALTIARRGGEATVRYADVALLASVLQDDLLAISLRQLYLAPLEEGRDDGALLRRTLLSYFEHERNAASAAAALGVTRQTVNNRLRMIEEKIGRPIGRCASELEIALRLPVQ